MNIPLSNPDITEKEQKAVLEVLKTPDLSLGTKSEEFEKKFARYAERKYAVAVNSGTAGLHLIIRALGIKEGDEVITTPFSFIASANCILYERARPVFCDINERTLNINPREIEKHITTKTKAVVVVDAFGHSADWDAILRIAHKHNLKVIEDSAEAVGGEYQGRRCGSFGDASIFSFYPNKQLTTGEGGVVLTNDKKIAELCRSMANQGRKVEGGRWLEHVRLGYNYRLPEIQCALGIVQLSRVGEILKKREKAARLYNQKLKEVEGVEVPFIAPNVKMSWFVYVVRLATAHQGKVIEYLDKKGIQSRAYFQAIHLQPLYKEMFGYKKGDFPITEGMSNRTLALPFFTRISKKEIDYVVKTLREAVKIHG